ncbi:hypothetical protein M0804_011979 [Polistes exclamans]|nr:hypothetical protein M0804_011979 [Polistes exclamans]
MSYGLNVEMHKQTEIAKRLNAIIVQLLPFLAQEHQQQVANAVERAKQVTMSELNAIIGINNQMYLMSQQQQQQGLQQLLQQIHAQQLPHGAVVGGLPPGGLLGFAGAAAAAAAAGVPPHLAPPAHPAAAAAAAQAQAQALLKPADLQQHRAAAETPEDRKPIALTDERLRQSVSPPEKFRARTPDLESDPKRRKEEKLGHSPPIFSMKHPTQGKSQPLPHPFMKHLTNPSPPTTTTTTTITPTHEQQYPSTRITSPRSLPPSSSSVQFSAENPNRTIPRRD